jgi:hypothetical protein
MVLTFYFDIYAFLSLGDWNFVYESYWKTQVSSTVTIFPNILPTILLEGLSKSFSFFDKQTKHGANKCTATTEQTQSQSPT